MRQALLVSPHLVLLYGVHGFLRAETIFYLGFCYNKSYIFTTEGIAYYNDFKITQYFHGGPF